MKSARPLTTQEEISAEFWRAHGATVPRAQVRNYAGDGLMWPTDTRCAFVDFLDSLSRDGRVSPALAQRATLRKPPALFYINRVGGGCRETVDEFTTRAEARAMLSEYNMADPAGHHYISRRCCANWRG